MHYVFFGMFAIIAWLAWHLHDSWGEIDDLYDEIDELKEEAVELERIARLERNKAAHFRTLLNEADFAEYCKKMKEAAS